MVTSYVVSWLFLPFFFLQPVCVQIHIVPKLKVAYYKYSLAPCFFQLIYLGNHSLTKFRNLLYYFSIAAFHSAVRMYPGWLNQSLMYEHSHYSQYFALISNVAMANSVRCVFTLLELCLLGNIWEMELLGQRVKVRTLLLAIAKCLSTLASTTCHSRQQLRECLSAHRYPTEQLPDFWTFVSLIAEKC